MASAPTRRPNLPALTGLRFFAAFYVVLYHYARFYLASGPRWLESFNDAGPVAVSLFFILSGLVLTYGSTTADGRCNKPPREFWMARFSRIYPLFAFAVVVSIPANVAFMHHTHSSALSVVLVVLQSIVALLLLQAWVPHLAFVANAPGWSLSVEAFFYAMFPFIVHRLRCRSVRQMLGLTIPLWIISITPTIVLEFIERHGGLRGTSTTSVLGIALTPALVVERLVAQLPVARLAEFCIGICIGHLVVANVDRVHAPESDDAAATVDRARFRLGIIGVTIVGALVVALAVAGDLRESSEIVVNSAFAAPLFAVLLISLTLGAGPLVALLSSKRTVALGTASYALYIIQDPFAWWWGKVVRLDLAKPLWLVLFLVAVVGASILAERFIEIPGRQRLLRRYKENDWPWMLSKRRLRRAERVETASADC